MSQELVDATEKDWVLESH